MGELGRGTLDLRTLVVVRQLRDGRVACSPLADASLVTHGPEADALAELSAYLREHLGAAHPSRVVAFAAPERARLHEVIADVIVDPDAPRARRRTVPIAFPCVVLEEAAAQGLPERKDAWVVLPTLGHTTYVADVAELDAHVRSEAERVVEARELSGRELLGILPPESMRLEVLELAVPREERASAASRATRREQQAGSRRIELAESTLDQCARELKAQESAPLVARGPLLDTLGALLGGKARTSVLLVGPELAGKSALVHAWLARHPGRRVFATSGALLLAGQGGFGEWQERVERVMRALETLDAVLWLDDVVDLVQDRAQGAVDLAGAIKPWLDGGRVRVLAEVRSDRLDVLESRHLGFASSFHRVRVEPLTLAETAEAIRARRTTDASAPELDDPAVDAVCELVTRYLPYGALPGKAIAFVEEVRGAARSLRRPDGTYAVLGRHDVHEAFARRTGMPSVLLREDVALDVREIVAFFGARLVGQRAAVQRVAETLCVVKAGLQPPGKPLATFLFVGPTGVGKTEVARLVATWLFGSPERLVRFDMSEFMDAFAADRLIRGTDRAEGLLTRRVRRQPFCVLLLDEIEKAHPAVLDLLLQVLGEGRLSDARGRTAFFHNTLVVMTSNLGTQTRATRLGFGDTSDTELEAHYQREVQRSFRAELVNRLDRIVAFHTLDAAQLRTVARLQLGAVTRRHGLGRAQLALEVSDDALDQLAQRGTTPSDGARALRRAMEDGLVAPLARVLSGLGADALGGRLDVRETSAEAPLGAPLASLEQGALRFEVRRQKRVRRAHSAQGVLDVCARRREVDRRMQLPQVTDVKERLERLVADLARAQARRGPRAPWTAELAEMQGELHRLQSAWQPLESVQQDLHALEEIVLLGALDDGPDAQLVAESQRLAQAHRTALLQVLLAGMPRENDVVVIVDELDAGGALELLLAPMLDAFAARRWQTTLHLPTHAVPAAATWPRDRAWTQSLDRAEVLVQLAKRKWHSVMLTVRGTHAGALLGLEAGPHVHRGVAGSKKSATFRWRVIAKLAEPPHWSGETVEPVVRLGAGGPIGKDTLVRVLDHEAETVHANGALVPELTPAEYWARLDDVALQVLLARAPAEGEG